MSGGDSNREEYFKEQEELSKKLRALPSGQIHQLRLFRQVSYLETEVKDIEKKLVKAKSILENMKRDLSTETKALVIEYGSGETFFDKYDEKEFRQSYETKKNL